jgi:hypothetical protein
MLGYWNIILPLLHTICEKYHLKPVTKLSFLIIEPISAEILEVIKTSNQWLDLRYINPNGETQEYEKQGNLSLSKVNNSTMKGLNDSEANEISNKNSKEQWSEWSTKLKKTCLSNWMNSEYTNSWMNSKGIQISS